MTPQDYIGRLQELVGAERYREAQALVAAEHATMRPSLTQAERAFLQGMLEVVAAAVEALEQREAPEAPAGVGRP